jgi:hypothetical protein
MLGELGPKVGLLDSEIETGRKALVSLVGL